MTPPPSRDPSTDAHADNADVYPEWVWKIAFWWEVVAWLERRIAPELSGLSMWGLRYGLMAIYFWFGIAKFWAPGELEVAAQLFMFFGVSTGLSELLGVWEVCIAVCFLDDRLVRFGSLQVIGHVVGTFIPLVVLPMLTFKVFPIWLALDGQHIVKNWFFIFAAILVWIDATPSLDD